MPHSAVSGLGLHGLPMSHKRTLGLNGLINWCNFIIYMVSLNLCESKSVWILMKPADSVSAQFSKISVDSD